MRDYVINRKSVSPDNEFLLEILNRHRKKVDEAIVEYQQNLQLLDKKINLYEDELNQEGNLDLFEEI